MRNKSLFQLILNQCNATDRRSRRRRRPISSGDIPDWKVSQGRHIQSCLRCFVGFLFFSTSRNLAP